MNGTGVVLSWPLTEGIKECAHEVMIIEKRSVREEIKFQPTLWHFFSQSCVKYLRQKPFEKGCGKRRNCW